MKKLVIGFCFAASASPSARRSPSGGPCRRRCRNCGPASAGSSAWASSPAVLNDLALALARVGRRDEARETIRRARTADPGNEHIRATEAEIGAK